MANPQIKGRVILDTLNLARERMGEEYFAKAIGYIDEPLRKLVEAGLVQSNWYPVDLLTQYLEGQVQMLRIDEAVFRHFSEDATFRQLSGTYRGLLQTDPQASVRRYVASHGTYWKDLEIALVAIDEHSAVLRFTGLQARHRLMEPLMAGYVRQSLHMNGAKNPQATFIVPIGDLSGHADMQLTWD